MTALLDDNFFKRLNVVLYFDLLTANAVHRHKKKVLLSMPAKTNAGMEKRFLFNTANAVPIMPIVFQIIISIKKLS